MNKVNITNNFMKVKEILFEWGYETNDIKNFGQTELWPTDHGPRMEGQTDVEVEIIF